ncbi:hypothetical protein BHS05_33240 [Myxococcus xanthus]|uniref:Lipoprotein n=2 Tax=Myxococcaceae TaxID=31 RepID=A0AAE6G6J0_MYXXA|nr:hypothetical protein BHS09_33380 [Myxococcus xanthus]QDE78769.1 hypothetical protein BHS08_33400 [Myxococcus xanthus]QDF00315.1 hypothetical protein BHS05_33240 [Myxococcus xanthus]
MPMSPLSRLVASLATLSLIAAACAGQQKPDNREATSTIEEVANEGGEETPAVAFNVMDAPEGFTVKLPGPPPQAQRSEAALPKRTDKATLVTYAANEGGVSYIVNAVDYPEAFVATVPAEALINGGIQGIAGQVGGELKSSEDITLDGYPGKAYMLASPSGEVKGRSFLVGPRVYNLITVYNAGIGAPGADEFLTSLTLVNPPPKIELPEADAGTDAGTAGAADGTGAAVEGGEDAGSAPDAGARRRRAK